jgi:hypothetical protein
MMPVSAGKVQHGVVDNIYLTGSTARWQRPTITYYAIMNPNAVAEPSACFFV